MRIDSTDASTLQVIKVQDINSDTRDENLNVDAIDKSFSQMTGYEKKELPISEKVVLNAIEKANKAISGSNRYFQYSVHEKTKEIMVKVIDSDTKEVIREIPPEKILDLVAKLWEMAGIIVDERR